MTSRCVSGPPSRWLWCLPSCRSPCISLLDPLHSTSSAADFGTMKNCTLWMMRTLHFLDSVDDADLAVFFVAGIRGGPWRGQLHVSKYSLNLRSFGYRTHLDEPFVSRSMEPITIALDFLKSSSRGGPRVPRPLLLVKVTAAAAARAAPLASRPKFTRYVYSFLHSRLSKKDTRMSASTRGGRHDNFFCRVV